MIAYFSAQALFRENPADQIAQNMKKKKDKADVPIQKQLIGFTYRLVFAPSLTSDSIGS